MLLYFTALEWSNSHRTTVISYKPVNRLVHNWSWSIFHIKMVRAIRLELPFQMEPGNTVTLTLYYSCIFLIKAGFAQFDISGNKRLAMDTVPLSLPAFTDLQLLGSLLTLLPVHGHVWPWRRPAHPLRTTHWWMMGGRGDRGESVFRRGTLWFDVQVKAGDRWGRGGGALGRVRTASTCRHPVHRDTHAA